MEFPEQGLAITNVNVVLLKHIICKSILKCLRGPANM